MGACGNKLSLSHSPGWKWLWVGDRGCWKDELCGNIVRKWGSLFSCMTLLSSAAFYLFKLILKSRISQKYSAANIFVCMRLPWQLLGLWQMSQDWDFCFPKHLCCFSWSFLESLGNEVRGFNSSSEAVCAAQCLCLDQGVILVRGKEMKQCSKSALVLSSFHTLYPSLQGISQSVGLCFVFYFILKTILC